jgi:hypothetical protein
MSRKDAKAQRKEEGKTEIFTEGHSAAEPQPQSAPEFLAELMDVQPQLHKGSNSEGRCIPHVCSPGCRRLELLVAIWLSKDATPCNP